MDTNRLTLTSVLDKYCNTHDIRDQESLDGISAICPHCGSVVAFSQQWIQPHQVSVFANSHREEGTRAVDRCLIALKCPSTTCHGLAVVASGLTVIGKTQKNLLLKLLWPLDTWPDSAPPNLDTHAKQDYDEARSTLPHSPTASAMLARRCLQYILTTKLGVEKSSLFKQIDCVVASTDLSKNTRDAIGHIRRIGNRAAHPSLSQDGELICVKYEEAEYLLRVLEMLFHDLYTRPAEITEMELALNKTMKSSD